MTHLLKCFTIAQRRERHEGQPGWPDRRFAGDGRRGRHQLRAPGIEWRRGCPGEHPSCRVFLHPRAPCLRCIFEVFLFGKHQFGSTASAVIAMDVAGCVGGV